jgi:Protein kinase domain
MSVRPGTRLDGRYRLSDRLAYGGMGEVWRATDEVLSRSVAVKILRPELTEDEAFVRRFRAEARTTSGLPHNGIAAVYDYGETRVGANGQSPAPVDDPDADPVAYLVMELVPGEALSSTLSRDGALGSDRTLDLVAQAGRALHAAHLRGVIHRDIKPANLMVTPDGRVKVTDFGIARPLDHEPLTATGQVMGTAHYLAPELAKGYDASPLSDVYALGVVAYECLAGHRPFEGDNQVAVALAHLNEQPPPLPGTISEEVRAVVGAAMEKDPQRRMPSAEAFAAALETLRFRQNATEDQLTPGTGILPGSAAAAGLAAAGLFGGANRGWSPGGPNGQQNTVVAAMAPPPVPATLPPPSGSGFGGAPAGSTGASSQLYGGGYGRGPYQGPPDPFRATTSPGGMSVTPGNGGRRPRRDRRVNVPLVALVGLGVVVALVVVATQMFGGAGSPQVSTSYTPTASAQQSTPSQSLTPTTPASTVAQLATTTAIKHRPTPTRTVSKPASPTTRPPSVTPTTPSSTPTTTPTTPTTSPPASATTTSSPTSPTKPPPTTTPTTPTTSPSG